MLIMMDERMEEGITQIFWHFLTKCSYAYFLMVIANFRYGIIVTLCKCYRENQRISDFQI